jgi:hypothetical protein
MPNTKPRRRLPPIAAAVVRAVEKRLSRIEDLLHEMRHEQDIQLKRLAAIQLQLDALSGKVRDKKPSTRDEE